VHAIGSNFGGPEPMSYEEIYGSDKNGPLVEIEADLTNVPWYTNDVYPLVYKDYPLHGTLKISATNRDAQVFGIVPTKAVFLYEYPYDYTLTESHIQSGTVTTESFVGRLDYYLPYYMYKDHQDLANQAANYVALKGSNTRLNDLITKPFPVIRKGDYWINIKYVLPGKRTVSSVYRHKIFNPID
jgi:hypothetical protein